MSATNKYSPHVFVLPEDDANNDLANGFLLHDKIAKRAIQVLPPAGGWAKVRDKFLGEHLSEMKRYPLRYVILLMDFDEDQERFGSIVAQVPAEFRERVFLIGVWSEPEKLPRSELGHREEIGLKLAGECFDGTRTVWQHELLQHNSAELARMQVLLRHILFPV